MFAFLMVLLFSCSVQAHDTIVLVCSNNQAYLMPLAYLQDYENCLTHHQRSIDIHQLKLRATELLVKQFELRLQTAQTLAAEHMKLLEIAASNYHASYCRQYPELKLGHNYLKLRKHLRKGLTESSKNEPMPDRPESPGAIVAIEMVNQVFNLGISSDDDDLETRL